MMNFAVPFFKMVTLYLLWRAQCNRVFMRFFKFIRSKSVTYFVLKFAYLFSQLPENRGVDWFGQT